MRLDDDDTVAAAQILSWIARPHRSESAMKVLDHWRRELLRSWGRGDPMPDAYLMRRNRIETQFKRLEVEVLRGIRAGLWLQWKILDQSPIPLFAGIKMPTRELARRRSAARHSRPENEKPANEIRDIWRKGKPVSHLALATGNALGGWLADRDLRGFGLSGAILQPTWVPDAIEQSEAWFHSASRFIEPAQFRRFHRDTF